MEKVLSTEERIRRAEELYKNRENLNVRINTHTSKKKRSLMKKTFLQILVCLSIYSVFYASKYFDGIIPEDITNKTKEILGYDLNFNNMYNSLINWLNSNKLFKSENKVDNTMNNEIILNDGNNIDSSEENNNKENHQNKEENIGGAQEEKAEVNLSQMEIDANEIKLKYNLIKPLNGTITSRYGHREPTTATVPKNHTGIDIAANTGTVIYSSLDGIVKISSDYGDYGRHLRIEKDDVAIYYAHCSKLYVKEGDYVQQGQAIAEVGATGNVTGPHLHFEIRKCNRYVNPDMVLSF